MHLHFLNSLANKFNVIPFSIAKHRPPKKVCRLTVIALNTPDPSVQMPMAEPAVPMAMLVTYTDPDTVWTVLPKMVQPISQQTVLQTIQRFPWKMVLNRTRLFNQTTGESIKSFEHAQNLHWQTFCHRKISINFFLFWMHRKIPIFDSNWISKKTSFFITGTIVLDQQFMNLAVFSIYIP